MSFHVFFGFSAGLSTSLQVPAGTLEGILSHVEHIEAVFGFEAEQYKDNPKHWKTTKPQKEVSDKIFCEEAERHNEWVRWLYDRFGYWSENPVQDGEVIAPEDASQFWHALETITVPSECWTGDYYRARMEAIYEAMRGRECEGMSFDAEALTREQAGMVITLFSQFLDHADLCLEAPKNRDYLCASDDYAWCGKCGAIHLDDVGEQIAVCKEKGNNCDNCSLRDIYDDQYLDDEE